MVVVEVVGDVVVPHPAVAVLWHPLSAVVVVGGVDGVGGHGGDVVVGDGLLLPLRHGKTLKVYTI